MGQKDIAAALVEMQRVADENEKMRRALQRIANLPLTQGHKKPDPRLRARKIAVGALGGKQNKIKTVK